MDERKNHSTFYSRCKSFAQESAFSLNCQIGDDDDDDGWPELDRLLLDTASEIDIVTRYWKKAPP